MQGERIEVPVHASVRVKLIVVYRGGMPAVAYLDGSDELFFIVADDCQSIRAARKVAINNTRIWANFEKLLEEKQEEIEKSLPPEGELPERKGWGSGRR